jgi:hypothetical protein
MAASTNSAMNIIVDALEAIGRALSALRVIAESIPIVDEC